MPQQINLCTPILLTQKRYFSALAVVQALGLFVLAGGMLCGYWVWSLNAASDEFRQTLATQGRELEGLRVALQASKAAAAPIDTALNDELATRRSEVTQKDLLLQELQRGLYREGFGHSARLQLVAQSIPPQVWVTQVLAENGQLALRGYTLEPAALNVWVDKLAASALLQGQKLAALKVEQVGADVPAGDPAARAAPAAFAAGARPVWSFQLLSGALPAPARAASGATS